MSSKTLPTLLLVPGACTTSACYDLLIPHLQQSGYPVEVASLPSSNPPKPDECTAAIDGRDVVDRYLLPLVKDGKDVIVFAHSFGATCLSGASDKLSKAERTASGQTGGVLGLVWITTALVPDGQSQVDYLGGGLPPFCRLDYPSPGVFVFDPAIEVLFNDADPKTAEEFVKGHIPHAIKVFDTPVSTPLWTDPAFEGRRVYIKTTQDMTFPPAAQQSFADNSGVEWKVVEVDGGHEAFMTRPGDVANVIVDAAERWS